MSLSLCQLLISLVSLSLLVSFSFHLLACLFCSASHFTCDIVSFGQLLISIVSLSLLVSFSFHLLACLFCSASHFTGELVSFGQLLILLLYCISPPLLFFPPFFSPPYVWFNKLKFITVLLIFVLAVCNNAPKVLNSKRAYQLTGVQNHLKMYSVGSTISYNCKSGYRIEGYHILTCTEKGLFSPKPPKCVGKCC